MKCHDVPTRLVGRQVGRFNRIDEVISVVEIPGVARGPPVEGRFRESPGEKGEVCRATVAENELRVQNVVSQKPQPKSEHSMD